MLGSAGWTGLQPAMFTRSRAASGRPAGGRSLLQRDGALGTCAERARVRAGCPQPKRRLGIGSSRARNQKGAKKGKHPAAHALRGPQGLRPSSPHLLQPRSSRSLSSSPFLCVPSGQRLPCRGDSSHRWEHFLTPAPKRCPGLLPPFLAPTVVGRRSPISRRVGS